MSNYSKKIISFLTLLCILFTAFVPAAGANAVEKVITRVQGFGLMEGYPDGDFGAEKELTRAEMAMIAARLLQLEDAVTGSSPFVDVPDDHWAKNVITILSNLGIINGMGNGTFQPDSNVSFSQAVKIVVSVLGYAEKAEEVGGYPNGYMAQAVKLGLLKDSVVTDKITRGEVANILNAALDVKPTGATFADNYPDLKYKLHELLTLGEDLREIRGILTETFDTSLVEEIPEVEEGYIVIEGMKLRCSYPMNEHLGKELIGYIYEDDDTSEYVLKSFMVTNNTESTEVSAENVKWSENTALIYSEDGKKKDEFNLTTSDLTVIYNGRLTEVSSGAYDINYGNYVFVNNDFDTEIEVLFINEAQSFIVDRVNTDSSTVYFKDREMLNGRSAVVLDANDDKDKRVYVVDAEGSPFAVESIKTGNSITLFSSSGQKYIKAVISDDTVEGAISEIFEDGVTIEDNDYKLALRPNGQAYFEPKLGTSAIFALDAFGNIINSIDEVATDYKYAYIIKAGNDSGLSGSLSIMVVSGQEPLKEVTQSGDDEIISYYFRNNVVEIYDLQKKVKLNGEKINSSEIAPESLNENLIAFKLNSDGAIKELLTYDISGVSYAEHQFNANILSFGGETVMRGYASDENTVFICVPESKSTDEDDYYVQVKIVDDSAANKVYGAVFFPDSSIEDPDAEPVDIMVINADMDASTVPPIQYDSDICVVGDARHKLGTVFDDEDSWVCELEILKGDTVVKEVVKADGPAADVAENLRKGDLVRYTKDGFGRIVNIEKIVSLQGLANDFSSDVYINSNSESAVYGLAYHVVPSTYDYFSNQMVDKIRLSYSADGDSPALSMVYRLFHEDLPVIYKYNRDTGWITPGEIEDIRTYNQIGSDADRILAIIEENDIKALVIISD